MRCRRSNKTQAERRISYDRIRRVCLALPERAESYSSSSYDPMQRASSGRQPKRKGQDSRASTALAATASYPGTWYPVTVIYLL